MLGGMRLQEWIHRMEVGTGAKYIRWSAAVIAFAVVALIYDSLCFRNFTNPETMDAAQLGRNIARGRGYTTFFVRPLSVGLTREHRSDKSPLLKENHRDISNAPLYPLLLAGVMLITPEPGDLTKIKYFNTYLPNMFIVVANQWLFGLGMFLVFKLARRWFNNVAAWMCALLFLFTELYWRFTVSGLSTILLMDLILLLVMLLSRFDERSRNAESKLFWNAVAIGLVNGLAMLTRYSLGWLILPVLIFTFLCGGQKRGALTAATLGAFVLVVAPWMVRNVMLSGLPFGTATYAVFETTPAFSGDTMSRTIVPSFTGLPGQSWILFVTVLHKGINGVREIISSDLPRLGGNWLWSFFLVGLLVRFQNGNLRHLRWFVVGSLLLLIPVQALTRTHLASESPEITSENLLVLFSPLVLIFGVGIFFVLFDFLPLTTLALRFATLSAFVIVISLPFALALLPPRVAPFAPPYYPPRIQQVARYMNDNELWMSDIPWAVAWYGERKCVWLTLNWNADFFKISDYERTVNGLFISTRTTDLKFYSGLIVGDNRNWADFLWQTFVRREIPDRFPLKYAPEGTLLPHGELLLTDRERWAAPMSGAENLKKD